MRVLCLGGPLSGQTHELHPGQSRLEYVQLHSEILVDRQIGDVLTPADPLNYESKFYDVITRSDGTHIAVEAVVAKEMRAMQSQYEGRIQRAREKVLALVGLS